MRVELSRFRVKKDKASRVDEWMKILNDRIDECVQTLDREQMRLEFIFREISNGEEYLYWCTLQGEQGQAVETSSFEIDRIHRELFEECIDHDYGRHDAQVQAVMLPAVVARCLDWENPAASAVRFQRREVIKKRSK
jgi:hypothetical protein